MRNRVRPSMSLQDYPAIDAVISYFQERTPGRNVRRTDYMALFSFPKATNIHYGKQWL